MSINRTTQVGNLTKDPELRGLASGGNVCSIRIAVNERRKDASGQWVDAPNFFNVSIFGNSADACAKHLSKGSQVAVDGRLRWREWQDKDGNKRESIEIIATEVQFVGGKPQGQQQGHDNGQGAWGGQSSDFGGGPAGQQPSMNDNWGAPPPQQTGPADDSDIPFRWRGHEDHRVHNHNPFA